MSDTENQGTELKKSFSSELIGTVFLLLGVLVFLSLLSYEPRSAPADGELPPVSNIVGTAGHFTAHVLLFLFGHAAYLLGPYLAIMGFLYIYRGEVQELILRLFAALVLLIATAVLIKLFSSPGTEFWSAGGVIGRRLGHVLEYLFGLYGAIILTCGIFVAGGFLGTRLPFVALVDQAKEFIRKQTTYGAVKASAFNKAPAARAPAAGQPVSEQPAPEQQIPAPPAPEQSAPEQAPPLIQKQPVMEQSHYVQQAEPPPPAENGEWDDMSSPNNRPFIEKREANPNGQYPWFEYGREPEEPANQEAPAAHEEPVAQETVATMEQPVARPEQVYHAGESLRISRRALEVAGKLREFGKKFPDDERPSRGASRDELPAPATIGARTPAAPITAGVAGAESRPNTGEEGDFAGHFNYDESRFHFRHAFSSGGPARERTRAREQGLYRQESAPAPRRNTVADDRPLLRPLNTSILEEPPAAEAHAKPGPAVDLNLPEALPVRENFTNRREAAKEVSGDFVPTSPRETSLHDDREFAEEIVDAPGVRESINAAADAAIEAGVAHAIEDEIEESIDENFTEGIDHGDAVENRELETEEVDSEEVDEDAEIEDDETEDEIAGGEIATDAAYQESEPAVTGVPPIDLGGRKYRLPLEILNLAPRVGHENVAREIELTCARLEVVMRDYGIQAKVVRTQRGPIVTLYEVKLEPGVKVSRILGINDEIKMNLEAPSIRIMAPIPGKPTVGIEIPNKTRETVTLGELARKDREFFTDSRNLSIVLGKDIAGHNNYVDLTKLPHLLIAGATGAGKSVYMNSIIASLLYTQSPEDVRFIMIDPKMVELTLYEGIPHLLMPVITDVRKASRALAWAVVEMEKRYAAFSRLRCRDIRSYNERVKNRAEAGDDEAKTMPYIVILLDELSDLMMVAAKDVEDSIIRLTQKARAVGIHVVMATQRPSVDVITALIKANCPARIAFQVAQRTDSRTILDANGAESLLGSGDMLYKSPTSAGLTRIQSPLITEGEIEKIVSETRKFGTPNYIEMPGESEESDFQTEESDIDQELFGQAWKIVLETGKTSTSYIQRRLRIGYNRAARIIEMMEERGYLGPAVGNKPREILKKDQ